MLSIINHFSEARFLHDLFYENGSIIHRTSILLQTFVQVLQIILYM
jgi:hypothetical protein